MDSLGGETVACGIGCVNCARPAQWGVSSRPSGRAALSRKQQSTGLTSADYAVVGPPFINSLPRPFCMTRLPSLSLPSAPRKLAAATIFLVSIFCCLPSKAASDLEAEMMNPPQMDAPTPVKVDIYFDDLTDISVVRNSFRVTAQMVLQWADPRLARLFNPKDPDTRNLEGPAAEALLARLWHPEVEIMNERGQRRASARALRISRDGRATLYEKFDTEAHLHGDMYFFHSPPPNFGWLSARSCRTKSSYFSFPMFSQRKRG